VTDSLLQYDFCLGPKTFASVVWQHWTEAIGRRFSAFIGHAVFARHNAVSAQSAAM
jgi:hypothetical protein